MYGPELQADFMVEIDEVLLEQALLSPMAAEKLATTIPTNLYYFAKATKKIKRPREINQQN